MNNFGVTYYSDPSPEDRAFIAANMIHGTTGIREDHNANKQAEILALNPNFKWWGYQTTDVDRAHPPANLDMDNEENFLHYSERTVCVFDNVEYTYEAGERVRVYNDNRYLRNLITPDGRANHTVSVATEWNARAPWVHGIFMDNSAFRMFNARVSKGGGVQEVYGAVLGSVGFDQRWAVELEWWLTSLNKNHAPVCANIANSWPVDLTIGGDPIASMFYMENDPTPMRNRSQGREWALNVYNRVKAASEAGIDCWFATQWRDVGGTVADGVRNNLAAWAALKQAGTVFSCSDRYQLTPGWLEHSWCEDMAKALEFADPIDGAEYLHFTDSGTFVRPYRDSVARVRTVRGWPQGGEPADSLTEAVNGLVAGRAEWITAEATTPEPEPEPEPERTREDVLREIGEITYRTYLANRAIDALVDRGGDLVRELEEMEADDA